MHWSDIPFHPPVRTLRQFALLWLLFFLGLAGWQGFVRTSSGLALALAVLAITIGTLGLLKPQAVRPIFVAWIVLTFPIGWTISRVILACMFYGVFAPVALFLKLVRRDALHLRPARGTLSYWTEKRAARDTREYFRQF